MESYFAYLCQKCSHSDRFQRLQALDELGKEYFDLLDANFLLLLLRQATDYNEQLLILSLISRMEERVPLDALLAYVADRDTPDWMLRHAVTRTLTALGERSPLDLLIPMLQDPTEDLGLREDIASALGEFGERVPLDVLLAAITDPEPAICAAALESLGARGLHAPIEPILAHRNHPEAYVRKAVVRALRETHSPASIEPILAALGDPEAEVREAAAMATDLLLEWFGARVPLAPIIVALGDTHANVRESSLDALANHPEYAPLDLVAQALHDENCYVRCAALLVLERLGASRVPDELYPIIMEITRTDPFPNARKYAHRALLTLKGFPLGRAHDFPGEEI